MQASVDHNIDAYVDTTVDRSREQKLKEIEEGLKRATPEIKRQVIEILKSRGYLK